MDALDIEKWRFVSDRYGDCTSGILTDALVIATIPRLWSYIYTSGLLGIFLYRVSFNVRPKTSISVSAALLGLVLVGRAAFVFPLSFLSNLAKKVPHEKISFHEQV